MSSSSDLIHGSAQIHPTAIIESDVAIGENTAIWDNVHVRGPAAIGSECIIGEKSYIAYGVTIGDVVKLNAYVYVCTGVTIESRVMIAAGVIFSNDRYPRAFSPDESGLATSEPTEDTLPTTVCEGATVGAGSRIGPGIRIGSYAMVGMGSVVVADVPAHGLVYGNPARLRGFVCTCGVPLPGTEAPATLSSSSCERCQRKFDFVDSGLRLRKTG